MLTETLIQSPNVPQFLKEDLDLISKNIKLEVKLIDGKNYSRWEFSKKFH